MSLYNLTDGALQCILYDYCIKRTKQKTQSSKTLFEI
jgi:hypothetical protein